MSNEQKDQYKQFLMEIIDGNAYSTKEKIEAIKTLCYLEHILPREIT